MNNDTSNHYADEPHAVSEAMPHHYVPYLKVFATLVVLTVITVCIGIFLRFDSEAVNVLLALLIAATKASLVALFFMHLKFESKLIYMIFIVPLALCVLLVVALLPDIVMTKEGSDSTSLHLFNTPAMMQPAAAEHR
jgi:cytochrome c oxidase subunit IV